MRHGYSMLLAFAALALTACAPLPTPQDVAISPPAPGLPPKLAAFSGTWEGNWDTSLPSRLIVEQIHPGIARIVYSWGDAPDDSFNTGYTRTYAKTLPGGIIEWGGYGARHFLFTMDEDRTSITGKCEWHGRINVIRMNKVDQR